MEVCNNDGMPVTTIGNEMPVNEMPEMTFDNEMGDGAIPDENHQIVNGVLRVTGGKDRVL